MIFRILRPHFYLTLCIVVLGGSAAIAQFNKTTVLLTGKVTDAETGQPVRARVRFLDPSGAELNKVISNSEGKYSAVLSKLGITYTVQSAASQRYVLTEQLPIAASESYRQESHDVSLKPIHAGRVMFSDVCFDFGSVAPRGTANSALAEVGKAMALNNEIEVTVDVSCDQPFEDRAIAADQGTQRANAVKNILTSNGAPANRVILKVKNPPPPPPPAPEPVQGKGKKKAKIVKKAPPKKAGKGKKGAVAAEPPATKALITITNVRSEDE